MSGPLGPEVRLADYDYQLPPDRIAQEPSARREGSRLLVLDRARPEIAFGSFADLGSRLAPGDLLVLNDARVFPARLRGKRATGGQVEVFLLGPAEGAPGRWRAMLRPARAGRRGGEVTLELAPGAAVRSVAEEGGGLFLVEVAREGRALGDAEVFRLCEEAGEVPLPPYIKRPAGDERSELDRDRYQTVYARAPGAVAAPTAGLHFSLELLEALRAKGIEAVSITLLVGLGTFKPVDDRMLERGKLFEEPVSIGAEAGRRILAQKGRGRVVAVGTTAARALEAWALAGTPLDPAGPGRGGWSARTDLLIAPGHRFRLVDALVTNFHLPRSSLLLLVSAFAGRERILDAYSRALAEGFRFYSYGDAMLIV